MPESHVVKTTCDLDVSRSPFGGCVTMLQGPPWLAINDATHGNSSGSVISRHQL